ncbi:MAG: hypothetical protein Q9213_003216 [Squamulea squamosa]
MQLGCRAPLLLKSHSTLLVFLAPSVTSILSSVAVPPYSPYFDIANHGRIRGSLKTQHGVRQASSAAAAPAPQQQSHEDGRMQSRVQPLLQPQHQSSNDAKERQLSFLDKFKNPSKNIQAPMSDESRAREIDILLRGSNNSSTNIQDRSTKSTKYHEDPGESSADMATRMRTESRRQDFVTAQGKRSRQGSIAQGMNMPPKDTTLKQKDMIHIQEPTRAIATIKSRPSLGRAVEVMPKRGLDLGRALRSLEINCAVNNVRGDAQTQRFHERPGAKRKRLHSLRWRRRFKIGFKAVVGKVKAMRRKGW